MKAEKFIEQIKELGIDTFAGVPDSTLSELCQAVITCEAEGKLEHHVPANEGAAIGIATGTFLATGKPACVYMQNSGLGNIVNPVTSLAHEKVYGIPMLLLVGWRGEPGVHDEPQHVFMGEVTTNLLELLEIPYEVFDGYTTDVELQKYLEEAKVQLDAHKQFAIVIKKGSFEKENKISFQNEYLLNRENVIAKIVGQMREEDVMVSTTGKISREVYEQAKMQYGHSKRHFLTVGGMGHASMIAYGIAKKHPEKRVYCLDGDGAEFMHMGSIAFLGKEKPANMLHICLNNDAHESVGGMPTGAAGQSYAEIAKAAGYPKVFIVHDHEKLSEVLREMVKAEELSFTEIFVSMESRANLGRPKESARENKENFMELFY